jgi:hypothetical protein
MQQHQRWSIPRTVIGHRPSTDHDQLHMHTSARRPLLTVAPDPTSTEAYAQPYTPGQRLIFRSTNSPAAAASKS